jgi:O-acetyl-ADP-ribose deacetylase (regulator of RNase III)
VIQYVTSPDLMILPEGSTQSFLIVHVCNDAGRWGAGFTGAISDVTKLPESAYRAWKLGSPGRNPTSGPCALGEVQLVRFDEGRYVLNMVAQRGTRRLRTDVCLDYPALDRTLFLAARWVEALSRTETAPLKVRMPRIGCGLAGGTWQRVGPMVERHLGEFDVTVFDLP